MAISAPATTIQRILVRFYWRLREGGWFFYWYIVLISVIEVASGEYDPDMTKMAKAAMKRYEKTTAAHRIRDVTKNSG